MRFKWLEPICFGRRTTLVYQTPSFQEMIGMEDSNNLPYKYASKILDTEQQQREHIRITWNTLQEIDSYDEHYCKRLLEQVILGCLRRSSLKYQIKSLKESGREKAKEIAQLKFRFKVCCWPDCKGKGTHKKGYD